MMKNRLQHLPTEELVRRLSKGEVDALDALYCRFYVKLINYGRQIAGVQSEEEVKDGIQEIFIWLAQNSEKAAGIRNFRAYLLISLRRNLQQKKSTKIEGQKTFNRYLSRTASLRETNYRSPEEIIIEAESEDEKRLQVDKGLENLPACMREVLFLRFFEGLTYKEVGQLLHISDQVARNYASRALKKLRKYMENVGALLCVLLVL